MCLSLTLKMPNHSSISSTQFVATSSPCNTCMSMDESSYRIHSSIKRIINFYSWDNWYRVPWKSYGFAWNRSLFLYSRQRVQSSMEILFHCRTLFIIIIKKQRSVSSKAVVQYLIYHRFTFQNCMHICCLQSMKFPLQPFRERLSFPNAHDITA